MRLYEYISSKSEIMPRENDPSLDELLTVLERDCKKFIKETDGFLFRGTNRRLGSENVYAKQTQRPDRKPVDTPKVVHDLADKLFKKKFGWKVRTEGLFTATRATMTKGYGANLYLVFPIGDYQYVWSEEAYDFYITQSEYFSRWQHKEHGRLGVDYRKYYPPEEMEEIVSLYTNKNLKKAWADNQAREIILNCPKGYYYVNSLSIGELSYYLNIDRY